MAGTKTINRSKYVEYTTSEVVLKNKKTLEETYMDTLTSDSLSKDVEELEIKAGISNSTLMKIDKKVDYKFQAVVATSNESLTASKLGAEKKETADGSLITLTQFPTNKAVKKTGEDDSVTYTITLDKAPTSEDDIVLAIGDTVLEKTTDYTISDKTVTIIKEGVAEGTQVYVSSYEYLSDIGTKYYDVGETNATSSDVFSCVINKPIYNTDNEIVFYRQIYCPKVQIDRNYKSEGKTEREQQDITYDFSILKDENYDYVMRITYIPVVNE